jgi:hypothetical protein
MPALHPMVPARRDYRGLPGTDTHPFCSPRKFFARAELMKFFKINKFITVLKKSSLKQSEVENAPIVLIRLLNTSMSTD